jgi:hypothetical protein
MPRGHKYSRQHWENLVSRWRESGTSIVKFAEAQNCNVHTFRYWVQKSSQPAVTSAPAFVKVALPNLPERSKAARLAVCGGIVIEVAENVAKPKLLAAVLFVAGLLQ